jgi:hypothetical protein
VTARPSGVAGGLPGSSRPLRLGPLLASGVIDSAGLAFGWTIILLEVTQRSGLGAAALQSAAMLTGIALSAPFSAWLSTRLSPRDLLRVLAVAEGACRLGVFALLWLEADARLMAPLVAGMNVLAWSAFAGMRAEVSRAEAAAGSARSLTWYAVAIASSEALAAGAAALLLDSTPSTPVLAAVAVGYVLSLAPQWWVGTHADPVRHPQPAPKAQLRAVIEPAGLGAGVFLLAGAPALLATVLSYELYGSKGVVVSAVAFTVCSLGAARVQGVLSSWRPTPVPAFVLGAVMVGGWSLSGHTLIGLAVAQGCAGLAQCSLEGELDTRVVARVRAGAATAGLAFASSSRALGGALSVALLPAVLHHTSLPAASAAMSLLLFLAAGGVALNYGLHPSRRVPASFVVGFAAGMLTGVVTDAAVRVRETAGVSRPSMPAWGRR